MMARLFSWTGYTQAVEGAVMAMPQVSPQVVQTNTTFQFSHVSQPNPNSVTWDIDSNGSIDSTSASFSLASTSVSYGEHSVRFRATNAYGVAEDTITIERIDNSAIVAPPQDEALRTVPSGTALLNFYSNGAAGDVVSWGTPFTPGTVLVGDLADLFLYDGTTVIPVQADNYILWTASRGTGVQWARLTAKLPAGIAYNKKLTLFKSATETTPAAPAYTMTDDFVIEFSSYRQPAAYLAFSHTGWESGTGDQLTLTLSDSGGPDEVYTYTLTANDLDRTPAMQGLTDQVELNPDSRFRLRKTLGSNNAFIRYNPASSTASDVSYRAHNYWSKAVFVQKPLSGGEAPRAGLSISLSVVRAAGSTWDYWAESTLRTAISRKTFSVAWNDLSTFEAWGTGHQMREEIRIGVPTAVDTSKMEGLRVWMSVKKDRDGNVTNAGRTVLVAFSDMKNANVRQHQYDAVIKVNGVEVYSQTDMFHGQFVGWVWPIETPTNFVLGDKSHWRTLWQIPQFEANAGGPPWRTYEKARHLNLHLDNPVDPGSPLTRMHPAGRRGVLKYDERFKPFYGINYDFGGGTAGGGPYYSIVPDEDGNAVDDWCFEGFTRTFDLTARNQFMSRWAWCAFDETTADPNHLMGPINAYDLIRRQWNVSPQPAWAEGVHKVERAYEKEKICGAIVGIASGLSPSHCSMIGLVPYQFTGHWLYYVLMEAVASILHNSYRSEYRSYITPNTTFSADGVYLITNLVNGSRTARYTAFAGAVALYTPELHRRKSYWNNVTSNHNDWFKKVMGHYDLGVISAHIQLTSNANATELKTLYQNWATQTHTKGVNDLYLADWEAEQQWQFDMVIAGVFFAYALGQDLFVDTINEMSKVADRAAAWNDGVYWRVGYISIPLTTEAGSLANLAPMLQTWTQVANEMDTTTRDWSDNSRFKTDFQPRKDDFTLWNSFGAGQEHGWDYRLIARAVMCWVAHWGVAPYKARAQTAVDWYKARPANSSWSANTDRSGVMPYHRLAYP